MSLASVNDQKDTFLSFRRIMVYFDLSDIFLMHFFTFFGFAA